MYAFLKLIDVLLVWYVELEVAVLHISVWVVGFWVVAVRVFWVEAVYAVFR